MTVSIVHNQILCLYYDYIFLYFIFSWKLITSSSFSLPFLSVSNLSPNIPDSNLSSNKSSHYFQTYQIIPQMCFYFLLLFKTFLWEPSCFLHCGLVAAPRASCFADILEFPSVIYPRNFLHPCFVACLFLGLRSCSF